MKRSLTLCCAVLAASMLTAPARAGSDTPAGTSPEAACRHIAAPTVPGAVVESVTARVQPAGDVSGGSGSATVTSVPAVCDVTVVVSHPGVGDHVSTRVWLPLSSWNGRFQATGGGGYLAGGGATALAAAVQTHYAAATTDAGVGSDNNALSPASWALNAQGQVNTGLLENFAGRSLHDMAVIGKQLTAAFYDRHSFYSYWNGCSTGGRQGLMMAQRYPHDFDGISAAAPAINWDRFIPAELWPQVVMNQEHDLLSSCELNAFTQAAIKACDADDGVTDGVVDDPDHCGFDPRTLIGTTVVCAGRTLVISAEDAKVVSLIWQGPVTGRGQRLWYGLNRSAPLTSLAGTTATSDGSLTGAPFPISDNWFKYFLARDPSFDTSTLSYADFERYFRQSQREYNRVIGTDSPDLSAFKAAGGKMVTWHGLADPLIFAEGTVDYRKRVEQAMGGARQVDSFYRVFLAPGVGHCGGGNGPVPTDPLAAVVDWVEHGKAPQTLPAATTTAGGTVVTRNLCRYPLHAQYRGEGPTTSADSYTCRR
ncbi:tannase/feruloyl esterase family alpha/beta hydrolase [Streptomyces sp. cg40]|uniref:tannase/feruloyl esterase family alpha/beta hydrolase n=1 Tax=Streptomyces sp. cg40 TaxID=3419764 RepID=UPI003D036A13